LGGRLSLDWYETAFLPVEMGTQVSRTEIEALFLTADLSA
jgi:hypothetical protein